MKEINFKIYGLDCANCARKIEEKITKLPSVSEVKVVFTTGKLTIKSDEEEESLLKKVKLIVKEIEPDAYLAEKIKPQNYIEPIMFAVGLLIGILGLFVFKFNVYLYWISIVFSALCMGYKTFYKAIYLLLHKNINENMLVSISVIGAIALGEHMEGLMVIALYSIGKMLEQISVNKSRKSIKKLTELQPEYANILLNGEEKKVSPEEVQLGDIIIVKKGEKIALDGKIVSGEAQIDMKHITGESTPETKSVGMEVVSGSIVLSGFITLQVTALYKDSTASKILKLIETAAEKKSKTETFISKFAKYYTLIVVALSIFVFGLTWLILKDINVAIYRGLIFLVISCPCAFAISVPLSYFSGIGNASKKGILIKGSNYLDAAAKLKTIAFDKTGTLTTGQFSILGIELLSKKHTEEQVLKIVYSGEKFSIHPLAKSIVQNYSFQAHEVSDFKEIDGKGIEYKIENKSYFVGKSDKERLVVKENGKIIAKLVLGDEIKSNSFEAIAELKKLGIKTVMLSGDKNSITQDIATKLQLDEYHGEMLPEDKYNYIQANKQGTGFVGDGVNDAPSLSLADVGISMGLSGSPASVEASDIVLVDDNPAKLPKLIKLSRFTKKLVIENIAFAGLTKTIFLALGAFGITGMLVAVFADVGVTLLAILNSLRVLNLK